MFRWNACLVLLPVLAASEVSGQTALTTPDIPGIVSGGTPVILVKSGLNSAEGPVAAPDGSLYFTEPSDNRIYRVDAAGQITVLFDARRTDDRNGERWRLPALAVDRRGRVFAARRAGPGRIGIAIVYPPAEARFIADSYRGKPFTAPNDLTMANNGGIYFTDPGEGPDRPHAVYYVKPSGEVLLATDNLESPNGILLSRDEKTLYVADSRSEYILAFDVHPDGTLGSRGNAVRLKGVRKNPQGVVDSGIDGLALDSQGDLYAISHDGVEVFNPQGVPLGVISVGTQATNLAFAGRDGKTLYITTHGSLYQVRMLAQRYPGRAK